MDNDPKSEASIYDLGFKMILTSQHGLTNSIWIDGAPAASQDLKRYTVYLDDGEKCFKIVVTAEDEEAAAECVKANGEVIAVREYTEPDIRGCLTVPSDGGGELDYRLCSH